MNRKKVFVVIIVLLVLVAFISTSSIAAGESQAVEKPIRYMFVQSAHAGSFVSVEGEENLYILTLEGVSPQTIAFSDRPERVVGQVPMQQFLDGLGFSPENPPNAAIEILEGDEEGDVIVCELLDPIYDAAGKTLQYTVSILEEPNHSYAIYNERHDQSLPEHFGPAALFIDDCPDGRWCCSKSDKTECGTIRIGTCWQWLPPGCFPCHSDYSYYLDKCAERFGDHCKHSCR